MTPVRDTGKSAGGLTFRISPSPFKVMHNKEPISSQTEIFHKGIGELNGPWKMLFKVVLSMAAVVLPFVVMLNVWFIKQTYAQSNEINLLTYKVDQYLQKEPVSQMELQLNGNLLRSDILESMDSRYSAKWLEDKVDANKVEINRNTKKISEYHQ